jgi:hypothetical protein
MACICHFRPFHRIEIRRIIEAGDAVAELERQLVGCAGLEFDDGFLNALWTIIKLNRMGIFRAILPLFYNRLEGDPRNKVLTDILQQALYHNRLAFADHVLEQDFRIHHTPAYHYTFWRKRFRGDPPRNLDDLKAFIDRHPDLAPTSADFEEIKTPQEVIDLIHLAYFCVAVAHQAFDANRFFIDFLNSIGYGVTRDEMARMADALLQCGMEPSQHVLNELKRLSPYDALTYKTIDNFPG